MTRPATTPAVLPADDTPPGEVMFRAAVEAARGLVARHLFVFADSLPDLSVLARVPTGNLSLVLVSHGRQAVLAAAGPLFQVLSIPDVELTRRGQIRAALLLARSEGLLASGEIFVCLTAESGEAADTLVTLRADDCPGDGVLGLDKSGVSPARSIKRPVFARVLNLCLQLGQEGREGKPVGTSFIVGDHRKVAAFTQQLIMNPFRGYSETRRNVLDPQLEETIKGFGTLDGGFVLKGSGVVMSAGTYLTGFPRLESSSLTGLGTRHHSAAAVTAVTGAVAFVISESTGTVRVFRRGRMLTEIERAGGNRPSRVV